jgi:hypothetical protein
MMPSDPSKDREIRRKIGRGVFAPSLCICHDMLRMQQKTKTSLSLVLFLFL